jgi:hypothetical protein
VFIKRLPEQAPHGYLIIEIERIRCLQLLLYILLDVLVALHLSQLGQKAVVALHLMPVVLPIGLVEIYSDYL